MNISKKLTAISLVPLLLVGISFADTNDQTQAATTNDAVATQTTNNIRTDRSFASPLREDRLDRRHDRRAF